MFCVFKCILFYLHKKYDSFKHAIELNASKNHKINTMHAKMIFEWCQQQNLTLLSDGNFDLSGKFLIGKITLLIE